MDTQATTVNPWQFPPPTRASGRWRPIRPANGVRSTESFPGGKPHVSKCEMWFQATGRFNETMKRWPCRGRPARGRLVIVCNCLQVARSGLAPGQASGRIAFETIVLQTLCRSVNEMLESCQWLVGCNGRGNSAVAGIRAGQAGRTGRVCCRVWTEVGDRCGRAFALRWRIRRGKKQREGCCCSRSPRPSGG